MLEQFAAFCRGQLWGESLRLFSHVMPAAWIAFLLEAWLLDLRLGLCFCWGAGR
jgi:hypothetical protein